jgi:branched-subunit amino acid aminotransferase/4-amino-4-deoxychorismate lyase
VAPVGIIDGRQIGNGKRGQITERLQKLYLNLLDQSALKA